MSAGRAPQRWGGSPPSGPDDARKQILNAAERCIARFGVEKTTVQDVAREAGIHRSTLYEYFPGRDALLVALFVRESAGIFAGVSHHLSEKPLIAGLIDAIADGLDLVRESEYASLLLGREGVGSTISATAASTAWDRSVQIALTAPLTAAVEAGEVRSDVPLDEIVRWIVRIALSVTSEPPADLRLTLHRFLAPALAPPLRG